MKTKRTAFFVSDGTGITAEALGNSLLIQFEGVEFEQKTLPYIDSEEKAQEAVEKINHAAGVDGERPIIFDTIVDRKIRKVLSGANGFMVDIFSTFLEPLEKELGNASSYSVGKSHSIARDNRYKKRIEAMHFAMDNDDGARTRSYQEADVILTGVSRCGKTPTCIYLALQFGIRAANYPITEDDLEDMQLPKVLRPHKGKLFGLTIDIDRLAAIRQERKPGSRYASHRQCEMEVEAVESLFRQLNIPFLNTTDFSVEEISTRILQITGMERHLK